MTGENGGSSTVVGPVWGRKDGTNGSCCSLVSVVRWRRVIRVMNKCVYVFMISLCCRQADGQVREEMQFDELVMASGGGGRYSEERRRGGSA